MTTRDRDIVAALGEAIARRIGEPRYNLWFRANTKFAWQEDWLVVGVPNHFYQEWLESTYGEMVRAAAADVIGAPVRVRFAIDAELFQAQRREQQAVAAVSEPGYILPLDEPAAPAVSQGTTDSVRPPARHARRWRRLNHFVVGSCNRLAHAAAVNVIESPGDINPLVLHGPVGTGKTHLLEGIYVGLRKAQPGCRVCFITAEEFTNRFVQALRLGKLAAFRKQFRECDALLMDDLNFLVNKRASVEEFQHTLDALLADGRPVVVTCDCHPKLAGEFAAEMTDRLLGGAVWGLQPPDADTRLAILRTKAASEGISVPEDVLCLLAARLRGNVRELEGALHTLRHFCRVTGRAVDAALAREALAELFRHSVRVLQLTDVDQAVCRALQLNSGALQAKQRAWAVSHPRMLAMYLSRKHTAAAYGEIGRHFGGRNHSTVVAAEKKVRQWLQTDAEMALGERCLRIRDVVELIERELTNRNFA